MQLARFLKLEFVWRPLAQGLRLEGRTRILEFALHMIAARLGGTARGVFFSLLSDKLDRLVGTPPYCARYRPGQFPATLKRN